MDLNNQEHAPKSHMYEFHKFRLTFGFGKYTSRVYKLTKKQPEGECRPERNNLGTCRKSEDMNSGKDNVKIFK